MKIESKVIFTAEAVNRYEETIQFNNKQYPVRTIDFPGHGLDGLKFATDALISQLMNENRSEYISKEAEQIDDTIVFYVPEEIFANLSDKELVFYMDENR